MVSFNPHNTFTKYSHFINWGTEKLRNFPMVMGLARSYRLESKPPTHHQLSTQSTVRKSLPWPSWQVLFALWETKTVNVKAAQRTERGQRDSATCYPWKCHPAPLSSNRETPGTQSHKEQSLGRSTKTSLTEQRVIKWQETDHREQKLWVLAETSLSTHSACSTGPYITFPSDC